MLTNPRDAMLCRLAKFGDFRFSKWRYDVIADYARLAFDGDNILLKLHVDHVNILRDIAIFIFRPV